MSELDAKAMAQEAKAVLENAAFERSFKDMLDGVNSTLADLPLDDTEGRLAQTYLITAAAGVKKALLDRIGDWQLIQDEANRQQADALDKME